MRPITYLFDRRAGLACALLVASSLLCAALPAIADDRSGFFHGSDQVIGSGRVTTEARAVTGYRAIVLRGGLDLVLKQNNHEGVELKGDDNVLPLIETRVVDRGGVPTLEIGPKDGVNFSTRTSTVATVDLVTLNSLAITGSGDATGDALAAPSLRLTVSGSGNVKLRRLATDALSVKVAGSGGVAVSGHAAKVGVSISGSGSVDGGMLDADDVTVSVAGSGDAIVKAHKTLGVSIAGSGDVIYAGEAAVKSSIAGSGTVKKQ